MEIEGVEIKKDSVVILFANEQVEPVMSLALSFRDIWYIIDSCKDSVPNPANLEPVTSKTIQELRKAIAFSTKRSRI